MHHVIIIKELKFQKSPRGFKYYAYKLINVNDDLFQRSYNIPTIKGRIPQVKW